jgi:hypothetical protein
MNLLPSYYWIRAAATVLSQPCLGSSNPNRTKLERKLGNRPTNSINKQQCIYSQTLIYVLFLKTYYAIYVHSNLIYVLRFTYSNSIYILRVG